jgi:hypothetical protein
MSDYLTTLVARSLELVEVIQPRLPGLFEPFSGDHVGDAPTLWDAPASPADAAAVRTTPQSANAFLEQRAVTSHPGPTEHAERIERRATTARALAAAPPATAPALPMPTLSSRPHPGLTPATSRRVASAQPASRRSNPPGGTERSAPGPSMSPGSSDDDRGAEADSSAPPQTRLLLEDLDGGPRPLTEDQAVAPRAPSARAPEPRTVAQRAATAPRVAALAPDAATDPAADGTLGPQPAAAHVPAANRVARPMPTAPALPRPASRQPAVAETVVRVNIGRVEVRAIMPPTPPPAPAPAQPRSTMSLAEYLKRRDRAAE